MFHLPIPIEGCSGEPVSVQKRQSRGYEYTILKYEYPTTEGQSEPYTVVTNAEQTKVFAYMAPRETIDFSRLMSYYQAGDVVEAKESIEGTMITFFWNDDTEEWNICTRNGIGGEYSFIRPTNKGDPNPKTFREMVVDAFRNLLAVEKIAKPEDVNDLTDVPTLNLLSKTHCYTCILQHPANHIVYPRAPFGAFLRLVAIYETDAMPPLVSPDSDVTYRECVRELANPDYPEIAKSYLEDSKEDGDDEIWKIGFGVFNRPRTTSKFIKTSDGLLTLKNEMFDKYVDTMILNHRAIHSIELSENEGSLYYPPSWIFTNNRTGQRCEVKNPFYELAKGLRDMQPNMRYQYLTLRKNNQLGNYLRAFPKYRNEIAALEKEYEDFITEVHSAYVKFYIKKERDTKIPKQHFVHAARIHHNVYMAQQELPRRKVNRETVYAYFDRFSASKMFYFLTRTEEEGPTEKEPTEEGPTEEGPTEEPTEEVSDYLYA